MYLTWSSFNNIRMLLMACMPVVIFYLIWLVNTSEAIRSEEGTLLDLVCWPDGNAIPVLVAIGSIIAIVIEIYGLYQLFRAGLPKREYDVTNGFFYYIWAIIIMIIIFLAIMFYSGLQSTIIRAKIKGGITNAMLRYASHLPSKVAIDRLQTRFHCCGRVNFQEWFFIPWLTTGEQVDVDVLTNRKFVADNVPYSCCSMDALYPCIHHGVMQKGNIYKYNPNLWILQHPPFWSACRDVIVYNNNQCKKITSQNNYALVDTFIIDFEVTFDPIKSFAFQKQQTIWKAGCEEKLISEMMTISWRFNAVTALIIIAMILQVVTVRYLHTAYKNGLHAGNQMPREGYLLRSMTDCESQVTVFRKRKSKRARANCVASCRTPSASEFNSSDELLKPIYE